MNAYDHWKEFVAKVALLPEFITTSAHQRIHRGLTLVIPGEDFMRKQLAPGDFQYTQAKLTQLTNHYFDSTSIVRARSDVQARITERKYGSGCWVFRNIPKKNTRQDFCIASGTMSFYPKRGVAMTIHYRTTELLRRFTGDLVFFQQVLMPEFQFALDREPLVEVRMHFDNLTWHPLFSILILLHWRTDWERLLRDIKQSNPELHTSLMYFWWRYFVDPLDTFSRYMVGERIRMLVRRDNPNCIPAVIAYINKNYVAPR